MRKLTTTAPSNLSSTTSSFTPKTFLKNLPSPPPPKPSSSTRTIRFRTLCSSSSSKPPNPIDFLRWIPDWADEIQERGMRKHRALYTHDQWREHRSSRRHIRHLLSSLSSRVILSLVPPVLAFTSFAAVIAGYNSAVLIGWLPEWFPLMRASALPYQLTAPALALLLVFRTEASYGRFAEGRKAWMRVVSVTDDFARTAMGVVGSEKQLRLKKALLDYIMAFPVALKCHVIYGSDIKRDLQNVLEEEDLAVVLSSRHRPRCIIEFISQSLQLLNLDDTKRTALESKLSCFHEGINVCEQIMGIPIPLSYTRLTSRFLVLWHLTLPIILWDDCAWIVVPATFISAASLFCIEEVGVLIEEPFAMLALDELCNLLHNSIREAIAFEGLIQSRVLSKVNKTHCEERSCNGRP
ncbi:UPF0187 protein [Acorus calamus]|uniref:UPF0187 protein n=1 Tax=Acorus calamus TaxID=4465 RepID=A0AAV9C753_ACOCL|nr:UPF0187 protein [Acorus calamus]